MAVKLKNAKKREKVFAPAPEVLLPGDWNIKSSPINHTVEAHTAPVSRQMQVPTEDTPAARAIRLHEMAHVKWSPAEGPPPGLGVKALSLQACEDFRVNTLLKRELGDSWVPDDYTVPDDGPSFQNAQARRDKLAMASLLIAGCGTGRQHAMYRNYDGDMDVDDAVQAAVDCINQDPYDFQNTVRAAVILEALTGERDVSKPEPEKPGKSCSKDAIDEKVEESMDRLKDAVGEMELDPEYMTPGEKAERALEDAGLTKPLGDSDLEKMEKGEKDSKPESRTPSYEWGKMTITRPPLVLRVKALKASKKPRPSEEGYRLRSPHRAMLDGKIFSHKRRQKGGTLLIDQSGSMSLAAEDLSRLFDEAPLAQVAGYCGYAATPKAKGELKILGLRSKRVKDEDLSPRGGMNICDGPALEWLAKQEEPRIWVCDGYVTVVSGVSEAGNVEATKECLELCRKNRIMRVNNLTEARELLAQIV